MGGVSNSKYGMTTIIHNDYWLQMKTCLAYIYKLVLSYIYLIPIGEVLFQNHCAFCIGTGEMPRNSPLMRFRNSPSYLHLLDTICLEYTSPPFAIINMHNL